MKFIVEPEIFERFPGIRLGVLVVTGMTNRPSQSAVDRLLTAAEAATRQKLTGTDPKEHPRVAPWREIYRQFGSPPSQYRSSIESLLRRVLAGSSLPRINPLVDIYNYLSLKHLLPAGAEDLDRIEGNLVLGLAKGNESGGYIGATEISTGYPGEVVYRDDWGFICRRFNWREGERTKITPATKNAVVVIEALPAVGDNDFKKALDEATQLFKKHLGAEVKVLVLGDQQPEGEIAFQPGRRLTKADRPPAEKITAATASLVTKKTAKGAGKKVQKAVKEAKKSPELTSPIERLVADRVDETTISYQLQLLVGREVQKMVPDFKITAVEIAHPADSGHGDYTTNVAFALAPRLGKSPREVAEDLVSQLTTGADRSGPADNRPAKGAKRAVAEDKSDTTIGLLSFFPHDGVFDRVEVAGPGFINFFLRPIWLQNELSQVLEQGANYGSNKLLRGKRILLEHTSPNPQTTIMLGHLRNNFLGMAVGRLLEFSGAKVTYDCIVNDRGIHLCRSIWGYLTFARRENSENSQNLLSLKEIKAFRQISDEKIKVLAAASDWEKDLSAWLKNPADWLTPADLGRKPDHANLIWYVLGSRAYNLVPEVKEAVEEILRTWEKEDQEVPEAKRRVWPVWQQLLDWSAQGYADTYRRVGSRHDWVWREHQLYKEGKRMVEAGLRKGIFRRSQGAIVSDLSDYGLPDTVVVKTDGTALYHTFDLNLTYQKMAKFPADLYLWDIGREQDLYFKQLFAMAEQLGVGRREQFYHLSYALINFRGGKKMSTRRGDVIIADEVLDELSQRTGEIIATSDPKRRGRLDPKEIKGLAEAVAVGAIKYGILKYARQTTIQYDPEEALSLEGNSGPYLMYTYARAGSVLRQAGMAAPVKFKTSPKLTAREAAVLRELYRFPEVVAAAAADLSPHYLGSFLYRLAQTFNKFYETEPVIGSEREELRLALCAGTAQVIGNGLRLLGISPVETM